MFLPNVYNKRQLPYLKLQSVTIFPNIEIISGNINVIVKFVYTLLSVCLYYTLVLKYEKAKLMAKRVKPIIISKKELKLRGGSCLSKPANLFKLIMNAKLLRARKVMSHTN